MQEFIKGYVHGDFLGIRGRFLERISGVFSKGIVKEFLQESLEETMRNFMEGRKSIEFLKRSLYTIFKNHYINF